MEPAWDVREMREGVERGESGAEPWSQWGPARQIWLGKGIQSPYKGKKDAESCGTRGGTVYILSMWAKGSFRAAKETFHRCCNVLMKGMCSEAEGTWCSYLCPQISFSSLPPLA